MKVTLILWLFAALQRSLSQCFAGGAASRVSGAWFVPRAGRLPGRNLCWLRPGCTYHLLQVHPSVKLFWLGISSVVDGLVWGLKKFICYLRKTTKCKQNAQITFLKPRKESVNVPFIPINTWKSVFQDIHIGFTYGNKKLAITPIYIYIYSFIYLFFQFQLKV